MWKHIDRLYAMYIIASSEHLQVACLGGRIAADIYDFAWRGCQQLFYYFLVHAGARWVCHHYIGPTVGSYKVGGKHFGHIACIELRVVKTITFGVDPCIGNGFFNIFDADYAAYFVGQEQGYCACPGIEVV